MDDQSAELDDEPRFATTYGTGFAAPKFARRCERIDLPAELDAGFHPLRELAILRRLVGAAWRGRGLLLCSSRGFLRIELLAIVLAGLLAGRRRPAMVLYGEMYEPDAGLRGWLQRLVMRTVDRYASGYIVYSLDDRASFAVTWGVDPTKVYACGYYHRPKLRPERVERGDYLFAGGNSFRDYGPLVAAARHVPGLLLLIAASAVGEVGPLPANVRVWWPGLAEWMSTMAGAAAVIVPIAPGLRRSAGLLAIFEAMALGKVVIAPATLGVAEYIEDGVSGLLVDGTPEGYLGAIRWVVDPDNATLVEQMGRRAAQALEERYTLASHTDRLLVVMEALAGGATAPTEAALAEAAGSPQPDAGGAPT